MSHTSLRPEFEELVELDAPAIQVATGCVFTEGPVWHPVDHFLLFSDMPGDVRRRWGPHGGVVEVKRPCKKFKGFHLVHAPKVLRWQPSPVLGCRGEAGGAARGGREPFRGEGAQQPER